MGYDPDQHRILIDRIATPSGDAWRINYMPKGDGTFRRGGGCQIDVNADGTIQSSADTGIADSADELVEAVDAPRVPGPDGRGDPLRVCRGHRVVGDPARLHASTGWVPRFALEGSLADVLADWRSRTATHFLAERI